MLDRESTFLAALLMGWKALFLSDPDGIEGISVVQNGARVHMFGYLAEGSTFVVVFFFSTFLTTLLVAIFSDAYSKARKNAWVSLFRRRIVIAKNCILAQPKKLPHFVLQLQKYIWVTAVAGLAVCSLLQLGVHSNYYS